MPDRSSFEVALSKVLEHEGNCVYSDSKTGEYSKYGVSLRFLKSVFPEADKQMVDELTSTVVSSLYRNYFWAKYKIGEIADQKLATAVLDLTVNMGPGHIVQNQNGAQITRTLRDGGITLLQKTVNQLRLFHEDFLTIDGVMGPKTIDAVNKSLSMQTAPDEVLKMYVEHAKFRYQAIAVADPRHGRDIKGWMARAESLLV